MERLMGRKGKPRRTYQAEHTTDKSHSLYTASFAFFEALWEVCFHDQS